MTEILNTGSLIMSGFILTLLFILWQTGRLSQRGGGMGKIQELQATVNTLSEARVRDAQLISDLQNQLRETQGQLRDAQARIRELEAKLLPAQGVPCAETARKLLAVVGSDPGLSFDLAALRAVETEGGLEVRRCRPASWERFKAIINRARIDSRPIEYVHFSLHATAENGGAVLFEDGALNGEQLSSVLNGVKVVMVAGCNSDALGDLLRVAPAVVTYTEPITNKDAADVTRLFWLGIGEGQTPYEAYRATRRKVSADLGEFLEFHGESA